MIILLDLTQLDIANSILELQRASYIVEADLIEFYQIPQLNESLSSLQACQETFYGYYTEDALAGIISFKVVKDVLDIHRVAVHPKFFRRGIAKKLIRHAEELHQQISAITVCTGKANIPAVNLYLHCGFQITRTLKISDGLYVTEFAKKFR